MITFIRNFYYGMSHKAKLIAAGIGAGIITMIVITLAFTTGGAPAEYNGPDSNGPSQQPAPATVTQIHTTNFPDEQIFTNYYSDGHRTTCMVHTFNNGVTSGTGDCAPDGVSNGMTNP